MYILAVASLSCDTHVTTFLHLCPKLLFAETGIKPPKSELTICGYGNKTSEVRNSNLRSPESGLEARSPEFQFTD